MISKLGWPAITSLVLAVVLVAWRTAGRAWPAGGGDAGYDNVLWIGGTLVLLAAPAFNTLAGPPDRRDRDGWLILAVALIASFALFRGGNLFSTAFTAADEGLPRPPGSEWWIAWEAIGLILTFGTYVLMVTLIIVRSRTPRPQFATSTASESSRA